MVPISQKKLNQAIWIDILVPFGNISKVFLHFLVCFWDFKLDLGGGGGGGGR
jgi:hypothetical protein